MAKDTGEMTDREVIAAIRSHLARTFIGPIDREVEVAQADGTMKTYPARGPHRFVVVFDKLVAAAGRER